MRNMYDRKCVIVTVNSSDIDVQVIDSFLPFSKVVLAIKQHSKVKINIFHVVLVYFLRAHTCKICTLGIIILELS